MANFVSFLTLSFVVLFHCGLIAVTNGLFRTGHMKPLGEQRAPEGQIDAIEGSPSGKQFYFNYALIKKPVVMKQAAIHIPSFYQWNDSYMRRKFGHVLVDVAEKKLDKSSEMRKYVLKDFIKIYRKKELDISMLHPLRDELLGDMRLLPLFMCGGHINVLQEAYVWLSGKNTKSVLHKNPYDNVMCLLSGTKRYYMVDGKHAGDYIQQDGPEDKFPSSKLDVNAVNLNKYGDMEKAPWWEAKMEAGDCIYIPAEWWHQSTARVNPEDGRSMEFNVFSHHLNHINVTECEREERRYNTTSFLVTLDGINLNDVNLEAIRYLHKLEVTNIPSLTRSKLFEAVRKDLPNTSTKFSDFPILAGQNEELTVDEFHGLSDGELFMLKKYYKSVLRKQDFMQKLHNIIYFLDPVPAKHDEL